MMHPRPLLLLSNSAVLEMAKIIHQGTSLTLEAV
jgi:hypothetical protein